MILRIRSTRLALLITIFGRLVLVVRSKSWASFASAVHTGKLVGVVAVVTMDGVILAMMLSEIHLLALVALTTTATESVLGSYNVTERTFLIRARRRCCGFASFLLMLHFTDVIFIVIVVVVIVAANRFRLALTAILSSFCG